MPLGITRLTLLARSSTAAPAESYYFLYTSSSPYANWSSIQVDSDGNQFVSPQGTKDYYKIAQDGSVSWTKTISNGGSVKTRDHTIIDANGDLIVFGDANDYSSFLISLDNSNGSQNWVSGRRKNLADADARTAVVTSEYIYTLGLGGGQNYWQTWYRYSLTGTYGSYRTIQRPGGGYSTASMSTDGTNVYTGYNDPDGYRVLYKISGINVSWAKSLSLTTINCIATDSSGNTYVLGVSGSTKYLVKVDTSGTKVWERTISTSTTLTTYGKNIAVDSSGSVYIAGIIDDPTVGAILKISSSGSLEWARTFDTDGSGVLINDITVANDILYLTGSAYVNSVQSSFILKLPADGSGTGSYGVGKFVYSSGDHTISSTSSITLSSFSYTNNTNYPPDAPSFSPTYSTPSVSTMTTIEIS